MKIKFGTTLLLILFVVLNLVSQDIDRATYNRALGLDLFFINNFLPLDNTIGFIDNYTVHYIKYKDEGNFIRHAIDLDFNGNYEKIDTEVDVNDTRLELNYKISKGKKKSLFKNGYFLYGSEALVDYNINKRKIQDPNDDTGLANNRNTDQSYSLSIGPFAGIEYQFSDRISIYAETAFYLRARYSIDKFASDREPEDNFKDEVFNFATVFKRPRSLILFFKF